MAACMVIMAGKRRPSKMSGYIIYNVSTLGSVSTDGSNRKIKIKKNAANAIFTVQAWESP